MSPENPTTDPASVSPMPLKGMRVIDLTTVLFGPYASQYLGDYGADVIKVETPVGDSSRRTGEFVQPDRAAAFISVNRNKRSIVLDLKTEGARDALMRLVDGADVLMHNIRPQKLGAIGLDPAKVRARNPRLIYASLNGFSEAGPYAGRPAYDDIIQGMCGLSDLMGRQTGEVRFMPTVVADKTCAMVATHAILAALIERERTGVVRQVEVSMFETMVGYTMVEHLAGRSFEPAIGPTGYSRALAASRRPYRTRDGYLSVMPYTDAHWGRFFAEVGRPELARDERFVTIQARTANIEVLYAMTAGFVAERTTAQWIETCTRIDIPHGRYNTLDDLLSDEHLSAVGYFDELPAGDGHGTMRLPGNGVRLDGRTREIRHEPPRLGEHSRPLLLQAGYSNEQIDALIRSGAVREAGTTGR